MTSEQLQKANKLSGKIKLIDDIETEVAQFKKERYSGSLPSSVVRYISSDPQLALQLIEVVQQFAIKEKVSLEKQLSEL